MLSNFWIFFFKELLFTCDRNCIVFILEIKPPVMRMFLMSALKGKDFQCSDIFYISVKTVSIF